jgi:hypothetical protein
MFLHALKRCRFIVGCGCIAGMKNAETFPEVKVGMVTRRREKIILADCVTHVMKI